jgi:hypothetical protein
MVVIECDQREDRQRASKYLNAGDGFRRQKTMVAIRNLLPRRQILLALLGPSARPFQVGAEKSG